MGVWGDAVASQTGLLASPVVPARTRSTHPEPAKADSGVLKCNRLCLDHTAPGAWLLRLSYARQGASAANALSDFERASEPPFAPRPIFARRCAYAHSNEHVWKARYAMPPSALPFVEHPSPQRPVFSRPCAVCREMALPYQERPSDVWRPKRCVASEAATSRRNGALWTIQSRLLVWSIARRAYPLGRDAFPRERILPPVSREPFLRAHPVAPVRSSRFLARFLPCGRRWSPRKVARRIK